ncbi:Dph6-related ATP pyrophosphatase [Salisaeta longa]|uniref:Dph6-related ATP pyrophosphatase n=1 Tax=Salisaeta longa TaxID=503170 RepID=UPI00058CB048|nr:hypothetical protein [Salisaeta longa]
MPQPIGLLWSGGKDSAWMLRALRAASEWIPAGLLVTVTTDDAVQAHGTPLPLIRAQASAVGLPLTVMRVPDAPTNAQYEQALDAALDEWRAAGVEDVAVGDLYLEDVRRYREALLTRLGMTPHVPLWGTDTEALAKAVVQTHRAVITSVDTIQLDASFAGRPYDAALLDALPDTVDPCGEDGAFHTFVLDGPAFHHPVPVMVRSAHGTGRMRYATLRALG